MAVFVDLLIKLDCFGYFTDVIDPNYQIYYDIVKKPVFLSTMRKHALEGYYSTNTVQKLYEDVNQMIENVKTFHMPRNPVYLEGYRFKKLADWTIGIFENILSKPADCYITNSSNNFI